VFKLFQWLYLLQIQVFAQWAPIICPDYKKKVHQIFRSERTGVKRFLRSGMLISTLAHSLHDKQINRFIVRVDEVPQENLIGGVRNVEPYYIGNLLATSADL